MSFSKRISCNKVMFSSLKCNSFELLFVASDKEFHHEQMFPLFSERMKIPIIRYVVSIIVGSKVVVQQ